MKFKNILTSFLIIILALTGTILIGLYFSNKYSSEQLISLQSSYQIVIFIFTSSAGSLALIKYWHFVESRNEKRKWEKLHHLESCYNSFRENHLEIIQAFDYPHILHNKYLPLCSKAFIYDGTELENKSKLFSKNDMATLRRLDDFLEYFENLYFAISRKLITIDDSFIFLRYYFKLLCDEYYNESDSRLSEYIDHYYYNLKHFLKLCVQAENKISAL